MNVFVVLLVAALAWSSSSAFPKHNVKIVGGHEVKIEDYKYQVSLQTKDHFHFCGGSILDKRHVLTARHCVE